jgi:hypothetical protein
MVGYAWSNTACGIKRTGHANPPYERRVNIPIPA